MQKNTGQSVNSLCNAAKKTPIYVSTDRCPVNYRLNTLKLYQLQNYFHSCVTFTRSDFDDSCVTTVTVSIFWCDFVEHFVCHVNVFCVFLSSSSFCRNSFYRIEYFHHLASCMQSGRSVFLDFFLYFIVNSYFLSVYNFFYSFAISIFTSNFSCNSYCFKVVFFFYSQSDQAFSNFADFFCFCFCSNDFTMI